MSIGFEIRTLDEVLAKVAATGSRIEWLWDGYLARGQITLLTSLWKSGKTTLLAELLRALGPGEPFLGRATVAGSALVLTEELLIHWSARHAAKPFPNTLAFAKHTNERPATRHDWIAFFGKMGTKPPDLFVIDPLANVLPTHAECSTPAALDFLRELRTFAMRGGSAVLLLHHPSKALTPDGPAGRGARGVGVWSSFADILLELKHYSPRERDHTRRTIVGRSRYPETPRRLCYARDETTGQMTAFDPVADAHRDILQVVHTLLTQFSRRLTVSEMIESWPEDADPVARSVLYEALKLAAGRGELKREGSGGSGEPYRYGMAAKGE